MQTRITYQLETVSLNDIVRVTGWHVFPLSIRNVAGRFRRSGIRAIRGNRPGVVTDQGGERLSHVARELIVIE